MNKATLTTIIVIIGLLLIGWLLFWRNDPIASNVTPPAEEEIQDSGMRITAKHEFSDGTHIIAGEVSLPTPCHILTTESRVTNEGADVLISFESSTQAETCAQVITPARFKIEFEAREDVVFSALWNGEKAELNLVPVAEGETLDEFELFIKG